MIFFDGRGRNIKTFQKVCLLVFISAFSLIRENVKIYRQMFRIARLEGVWHNIVWRKIAHHFWKRIILPRMKSLFAHPKNFMHNKLQKLCPKIKAKHYPLLQGISITKGELKARGPSRTA